VNEKDKCWELQEKDIGELAKDISEAERF